MIASTKNNCGGEPRLVRHHITVWNIVDCALNSPEGLKLILDTFPTINKKDVSEVREYIYNLLDKETIK